MSQHISGDIGQSVRHDYGDFLIIGENIRVRKDLVKAFVTINRDPQGAEAHGINVLVDGHWVSALTKTEEQAKQELLRLDIAYGLTTMTVVKT